MADISPAPLPDGQPEEPTLRRSLSLTMLTLYGVGTTIGAGIFVLVGKIAGVAGPQAPLAFLVASLLAGLTAFSFAELSSRFPESAGEAAYVREGLRSPALAFVVGLMVVAAGTISSSAIVSGFTGYLSAVVDLDPALAICLTVTALGGVAAVGIAPSVGIAALISIMEVGALLVVIAAAVWRNGAAVLVPAAPLLPPDIAGWVGIVSGAVLAFYAFLGFEDIVNVAEETRDAPRTLPRAILLTLVLTLVLYVAVSTVAVSLMSPAELTASAAPLVAVFERGSGLPGETLALAVVVSVLNGALIQVVMASRVLYGMARRALLPGWLAGVHPRTRTPVRATALVAGAVMALALALPVVPLARVTSFVVLGIFVLVNLSLVALRLRDPARPVGTARVPLVLPVLGALTSAALLAFQIWEAAAG